MHGGIETAGTSPPPAFASAAAVQLWLSEHFAVETDSLRLLGGALEAIGRFLGVSTDSEFVHHAWRKDHPDLRELPFPMLADSKRELALAAGVLGEDGFAQRAVFVIDPDNEIQFVMVTAGSVGRNPKEVLRVLDALQTDELCPCNWTKGEATLDPVALLAGV